MITPSSSVQVLVATKPVDFRRGADGLAAYVQEQMKIDPFCGAIYVFRAKRSDRVRLPVAARFRDRPREIPEAAIAALPVILARAADGHVCSLWSRYEAHASS